MAVDFGSNRRALARKRLYGFSLGSLGIMLTVVGLFVSGVSCLSLAVSRADVPTTEVSLGSDGLTPALHFAPAAGTPGGPAGPFGTVIVVHGFAASKEFMRDLDYTLARAGFEVYGVDLPGHGRSGRDLELGPDLGSDALRAWFSDLAADMEKKGLLVPGRVYLVGHSLGTMVVTFGALDNPGLGVRAVVALSPIVGDITQTSPADYLALVGESEISGVRDAATKALRLGTRVVDPKFGTVYGDPAAGTARAADEIKKASHISIVDRPEAIILTVKWLRSAAGVPLDAEPPPRLEQENAERVFGAIGLGMAVLGAFYLAAGALGLLGRGGRRPRAADAGERATQLLAGTRVIPLLYALAAVVAVAVPGFLGTLGFLEQSGADFLAADLLVLAAVLAPLLAWTGRLIKTGPLIETGTRLGVPLSLALGASLGLVLAAALGRFVTFAWTNAWPPSFRVGHIVLLAVVFFPFAVVEELARGTTHERAGFWWGFLTVAIGKVLLMLSWYLGLLFPNKPTALVLVGPLLIGLWVALDLLLSLFYEEHGSWLASAVVKAIALAWAVGSVFPYVG